jgi:hypothetical protein
MISLHELDFSRLPGALGKVGAKELHLWLPAWLADKRRRSALSVPVEHVFFALCDHYEPLHGAVPHAQGLARVRAWETRYPKLASRFRDASGRPPRHSFFFPGEQYHADFLSPLRDLVSAGLGEVEVHLHHDGDTRASLRTSLLKTLEDLSKHDVISEREGRPAWAFIHGNWALANGRRDGRWCGVDDELELLFELGCYVDMTFPSAPSQCQPSIVNRIYYPSGDVTKRRCYEAGESVRVGDARQDRVLIFQGPLALSRKAASRFRPRIEAGAIDSGDPATASRFQTWVDQRVSVAGKPEWVFVKVHTHGAPEGNAEAVLGDPGLRFHETLLEAAHHGRYQVHYVTARELYNLARAAMDGRVGAPEQYYDYEVPPPVAAR